MWAYVGVFWDGLRERALAATPPRQFQVLHRLGNAETGHNDDGHGTIMETVNIRTHNNPRPGLCLTLSRRSKCWDRYMSNETLIFPFPFCEFV